MSALGKRELEATAAAIAAAQRADGSIPWSAGEHTDPWNMVEAAMSLDVAGRHREAAAAYEWLRRAQLPDGAWYAAYRGGRVEDRTRDANFCAYVASGVWMHHATTADSRALAAMWPTVERAVGFVLALQAEGGEVLWARDESYVAWPAALRASSACIHASLRSAIRIAETLGEERPDWELALERLSAALRDPSTAFHEKDRFSMDWYYPVLAGALTGDDAAARIEERWDEFVVPGRGVRCVSDRPWVTAAETAELVVALAFAGRTADAAELFEWVQHLRANDGLYWTGATFPDATVWPAQKTTWTAAAILLAADALAGGDATDAVFRPDERAGAQPASVPVADAT